MRIAIFGTGYVGLVTGTCLASLGNDVRCVDIKKEIIDKLSAGKSTIYEPGLDELLERNIREGRQTFTLDGDEAIKWADIIFICVPTPQGPNGEANLTYVLNVAKQIGKNLNSYKIVLDKSTVPVGTGDKVEAAIKANATNTKADFTVVSNPEFLKEGAAIKDFMNPERIVLGVENEKAREILLHLYKPLERTSKPILVMNRKSAEMTKYAANAMLATRISFMNELSRLCEAAGADIKAVSKGMGYDSRIGPRFLQAGAGYGGSCFPKDVRALHTTGTEHDVSLTIIKAVDEANEMQKEWIVKKCRDKLTTFKDKKIAIWGLAFKPKTDDIREAPAKLLIKTALYEGATITAFDPEAIDNMQKEFPQVTYTTNFYETVENADLLVLMTEWDEFREPDWQKIKTMMKSPLVMDARNIYDRKYMKSLGFTYEGIGRGGN